MDAGARVRAVARNRAGEDGGVQLPDDVMWRIANVCDPDTRMRLAMARKDSLLAYAARREGAPPAAALRELVAPLSGPQRPGAPPAGVALRSVPSETWPWGSAAPTMALDVVGEGLRACAALCHPHRLARARAPHVARSVVEAAGVVSLHASVWRGVDAARRAIARGDAETFEHLLAGGLWLGHWGPVDGWGASVLAVLDAHCAWTVSSVSGSLASRLALGEDGLHAFLLPAYFSLSRRARLLVEGGQLGPLSHLDHATALPDGRMHPALAMVVMDVDDVDGPVLPNIETPADTPAWPSLRGRADATWSLSFDDRRALFSAIVF